MTALLGKIIQTLADTLPIESRVSDLVAGVLENTASKLERFETGAGDAGAGTGQISEALAVSDRETV